MGSPITDAVDPYGIRKTERGLQTGTLRLSPQVLQLVGDRCGHANFDSSAYALGCRQG